MSAKQEKTEDRNKKLRKLASADAEQLLSRVDELPNTPDKRLFKEKIASALRHFEQALTSEHVEES